MSSNFGLLFEILSRVDWVFEDKTATRPARLGYEDWDSSPTRQRCWSGHDGSVLVPVRLINSGKSSGTLDTPAFHDKAFTWRPEGIWQGPWSKRGTPRTTSENPTGTKFTSRRYITKGCPPYYENGFASSGYRGNACFSSSTYHENASEKNAKPNSSVTFAFNTFLI